MSATNGLTGSVRSRVRILACALGALLCMSALLAGTASAKGGTTHSYLALGDSLAFGYSAQLYNENIKDGDEANKFENGYVNDFAKKLPKAGTWQVQDLGCPGETTESLIGDGAVAAALGASPFAATGEAPCAYQEAWNAYHSPGTGGPLHVDYAGVSQLEAALGILGEDALAGKPVEEVSFNIGANDQLAAIHKCEKEVGTEYATEGKSKYGSTPEEAVHNCLVSHVPALIETIIKNTEATAYALRNGAAFGSVNYTGQIVFQLGYDPYGVVFQAGEYGFGTGKELLSGSLGLASIINENEAKAYSAPEADGGFSPCLANPFSTFDPKNRKESERLQTLTNMANFTEFEGKKYDQPGADGPDIHPTPLGYMKLASIMTKDCAPLG